MSGIVPSSIVASIALTPIQSTSLLTAYWRDKETRHAGGLISDPTAFVLIEELISDEQRRGYEESPIRDLGTSVLALRTRFIDDWLLGSSPGPQPRCVANLGAGMCGRPYRLDLPGVGAFLELDSDPSLLATKHQVLWDAGLGASVPVTPVAADLEDIPRATIALQDALAAQPFPPSSIDWIAEGLLEYLDPSVHRRIFEMAHDLSPEHSRMIMQVLEPPFADLFNEKLGAALPWKPLVATSEVAHQANEAGWSKATIWDGPTIGRKYGRELDIPGFTMLCLEKN